MPLDSKEMRLGLDDPTSSCRRIFLYKLIFVQLLKKLSRFLGFFTKLAHNFLREDYVRPSMT